MQPSDFTEHKPGQVVASPHGLWSFLPAPLPPLLDLTRELTAQISEADRALSELAGLTRSLPNPQLLLKPFLGREAVLSSRIEGTMASLSDLFFFEAANAPPSPASDVLEVQNCVRAIEHGLARLNELPLSQRLLKEMHQILLTNGGSSHLTPGEWRRSQNWIGPAGCTLANATYVPPPPEELGQLLSDLDKFLNAASELPTVVRVALVHSQFEAIHPFLDGNGRLGRLLIVLMLCVEGLLPHPLLSLSAYFERNRPEYYRRLLDVSQRGAWSEWLAFFLRGLAVEARDAVGRSEKLLSLWQTYRTRLQAGRVSSSLLALVEELFRAPYITVGRAREVLDLTFRAASLNIQKLVENNILIELPGRPYGRICVAHEIVALLESP